MRQNTTSSLALGLLVVASPAMAQARPTPQDVEAARVAFDNGLSDFFAGRYSTGCPALAKSLRLDPRPGTLFTLAVCELQRDRFATAMKRFDEYLRLYEQFEPDEKQRQAERHKIAQGERLRAARQTALLTLMLPDNAPAGTVVKCNGEVIDKAQAHWQFPVDPGDVVVSTQAPGGPIWEHRFQVDRGKSLELPLEIKPATNEASTSEDSMRARRTTAYIIGGIGIAGLVLGGVTGGLALGYEGVGRDDGTFAVVSTLGFGVGIAGVGTATVLLLTEPRKPTTEATTGSRGHWVNADMSAQPKGILAGLQGVF